MMVLFSVLAATVTLANPKPIVDLDTGKLKGELARLAWSDDGSELYVQALERDRAGTIKAARHYIVAIAAKTVKEAPQEPPWAAKYWAWKSAQASPAAAAFKIAVGERDEVKRAASAPTGGALARGGVADPTAGTTFQEVANAADASQKLHIYSLKIRDETIGEWVNEPVTPGSNFSWAPAPLRLIAFTKRDGGALAILDESGARQELSGPKAAVLPAWSSDGRRIAWLEKKDRKKYVLTVAEISVE